MLAIKVENLSYTYMEGTPFEQKALKNISLEIEKGTFTAVIGHTGSGKSTLVQHFNGLIKPQEGKIEVFGIDTTGKGLKELRKRVGLVFQYPEHQLFEETVYKDVAYGIRKDGYTKEEMDFKIRETCKSVGVTEKELLKSPFELSGGQKRRVAIAGTLVMEPEVLILDEPAAGLDPEGRDYFFNLIDSLHKDKGITIILVSHSMEDVAMYADKIIVMNKGAIDSEGSPENIFKDEERLINIGLSVPQINIFAKRLNKEYPNFPKDLYTVDDVMDNILKLL